MYTSHISNGGSSSSTCNRKLKAARIKLNRWNLIELTTASLTMSSEAIFDREKPSRTAEYSISFFLACSALDRSL
jgi:hypothetical protein